MRTLLLVAFATTGCTLLPTQHGTAQFWGDYTNVKFDDGSVHFSADSMVHSRAIRAQWHGLNGFAAEAATVIIPGAPVAARAVAPAITNLVSGTTAPANSTSVPVKTH